MQASRGGGGGSTRANRRAREVGLEPTEVIGWLGDWDGRSAPACGALTVVWEVAHPRSSRFSFPGGVSCCYIYVRRGLSSTKPFVNESTGAHVGIWSGGPLGLVGARCCRRTAA
jgi:hypothetical protein